MNSKNFLFCLVTLFFYKIINDLMIQMEHLLNVMVSLFPKVAFNESKFQLESENDEHFHSSFNLYRGEETMSALGNTKEISYPLSG